MLLLRERDVSRMDYAGSVNRALVSESNAFKDAGHELEVAFLVVEIGFLRLCHGAVAERHPFTKKVRSLTHQSRKSKYFFKCRADITQCVTLPVPTQTGY